MASCNICGAGIHSPWEMEHGVCEEHTDFIEELQATIENTDHFCGNVREACKDVCADHGIPFDERIDNIIFDTLFKEA